MNFSAPCCSRLKQSALDRADRRGGDVAVIGLELLRVVADVLQHRAQVLQVEQQETVVVGDLEHERQHAFLRLVELEDPREQQRPEVGDRGADRVALLAEHIPENDRARGEIRRLLADRLQPGGELVGWRAGLAHPGQVAFHVGHEHRDANPGQALGNDLQSHRLAGARRAGDEPVAVGERRQERQRALGIAGNGQRIGHGGSFGIEIGPNLTLR